MERRQENKKEEKKTKEIVRREGETKADKWRER